MAQMSVQTAMKSAPLWILATGLASTLAVSAPVLLSQDDGTRLATAAEIRDLVESVALCPMLNDAVAEQFDATFGEPTSAEVRRMTDQASRCLDLQKQLPEPMQMATAVATLRAVLESNTYHLPQSRPVGKLKLSLELSTPSAADSDS